MCLPTFYQFIEYKWQRGNSDVIHPDFDTFYVRKGTVGIVLPTGFFYCHPTFTFARIIAKNPGNGAFKKLVKELREREWSIYVECVQTARFSKGLERMGFLRTEVIDCYLLAFPEHLSK